MDLTSPLTRTAAGLARRTLVPPLIVLDRHVVVPVLGDRSTAHRLLAAMTGATAAVTSHPTAAPAARGSESPPSSAQPAEDEPAEDASATEDEPAEDEPAEDASATDDELAEDEPAEDASATEAADESGSAESDESASAPGDSAGDAQSGGVLTSDEQERIEELTEQLLEEQRNEQFVGELADDELRRAQAQVRAKQIIEQEDAAGTGSDGS
jgi:hypothetical protein